MNLDKTETSRCATTRDFHRLEHFNVLTTGMQCKSSRGYANKCPQVPDTDVTDPILETNRLLSNYQKWQFLATKSNLFRQLLTAQKVWAVEERCQFWQVSSCP